MNLDKRQLIGGNLIDFSYKLFTTGKLSKMEKRSLLSELSTIGEKVGDHAGSMRDIKADDERRLVEERDELDDLIAHGQGDISAMSMRRTQLNQEIQIKRAFQSPRRTDRGGRM